MGYGYNPDNSLASITYPSGRVVSQSYDAIGRMATIASSGTNFLSGASYNAAGQALGFNYGNGVAAAFTYNDHLQLDSLRYHTSTQELLDLKYDYVAGVAGNNGQIQVQHYCTTALPTCTDDPTRTENFTSSPATNVPRAARVASITPTSATTAAGWDDSCRRTRWWVLRRCLSR